MLDDSDKFSLPEVEEKVLKFWRENGIFEKSLKKNKAKKKFVFYEGPPTANGRPGIHHVLSRSFKDIVLRYKTMVGFSVPRRAGWDTHGLPVEIEVEKKLGLKSKKEIEEYGVAAFNKKCRESVWEYKDEWEKITERIGFWLDMDHPYITYEKNYMESLWWIFSEVNKKKLLYQGHKVVPWCTRCGTALSSHELAQGYKTTEDMSVYMKFRLLPNQTIGRNFTTDDKTYILSWTTTPWTLPGNVALAVGENIQYVVVSIEGAGEKYVVASSLATKVLNTKYQILNTFSGKDFIGLKYEPLFDVKKLGTESSYRVYPADFVTTENGTGVVHTAVMYGEDDYQLGTKIGLPKHHTVDTSGKFTADVPELAGLYVKAKETEAKIFELLKERNFLFKTEKYEHEYPFCWRCGTPILYYARDSWFIGMSKLKRELLASNKTVNWVPATIKNGRFGEWLKDVKDWAISRERYWGTPLPVWVCGKCGATEVLGNVAELEKKLGKPKNNYWVMRHGEAENNVLDIIDATKTKFHLTARGKRQVELSIKKFKHELTRKGKKIDVVITSDILRTKETDEIDLKILGEVDAKVDKRLEEIQLGVDLMGCHDEKYHVLFPTFQSKFERRPEGGESVRDLRTRLWAFLKECEAKYEGKNILLVTHEYPIWMLSQVSEGWTEREAIAEKEKRGDDFIKFAEVRKLDLKMVPRNDTGEIDLHKPYIDEAVFKCTCGGTMKRIPEVADVWFDSGSMPFAEDHYPFENKTKIAYPADYIVEGIDQTRGWFYTLLAVATLLGEKAPYRNVISLGLLLDKNAQKMSKSKGNTVSPWDMIQKYGADVVRWYFYTVNAPGEPKRFDEADLGKVLRQFVLMMYNSYVFYRTYADKNAKYKIPTAKYSNILDQWILARLDKTVAASTQALDAYDIGGAGKSIEEFVNDLSRWYIRRSRRRFQKPDNKKDYAAASATLRYCLTELSKLLAPFIPFFADALYQSVSLEGELSVHLEGWPKANSKFKIQNSKLLHDMKAVRDLASAALAKRAELGIKVRQPLASLAVKNSKLKMDAALLEILKDEINVREVIFDSKLKEDFVLDTVITPELKEEGTIRELVRMIQDLRQDGGFVPKDKITLLIEARPEIKNIVERNEKLLMKEINTSEIILGRSDKFDVEIDTKFDGAPIWIGIKK
jgi:isoleucyl-tRNA synthetase